MYPADQQETGEAPQRVEPSVGLEYQYPVNISEVSSPWTHGVSTDPDSRVFAAQELASSVTTWTAGETVSHVERSGSGRAHARRRGSDERLTPEEEERRRIRRERNRQAAAKCRNRRRELTEELDDETQKLAMEQEKMRSEIQSLSRVKDQLEFLLTTHAHICCLPDKDEQNVPTATELEQATPPVHKATTSTEVVESLHTSLTIFEEPQPTSLTIQDFSWEILEQDQGMGAGVSTRTPAEKLSLPGPSSLNVENLDLSDALNTPVVTKTPSTFTPTGTSASLAFTYPSMSDLSCSSAHRRYSSGSSGDLSGESGVSPAFISL
uniref:fos-related antigen 2-like isoform X2 n=1 Tax=Myxine glutinosa TaxID=7769 RepID=UPI00358DE602